LALGARRIIVGMTIHAVVFDIGGVLEITPDLGWVPAWESRLGLAPGELGERMADAWRGGEVGTVSEAEVQQAARQRLGLDERQLTEFMADLWRDYLGTANTELIEYARRLRPRYRTGILSNSFVGAREREQEAYGFEDLVDELVYSHECGLRKPDPRSYALVCARRGSTAGRPAGGPVHGQRPGHQRHRGAPGQEFNILIIPNGPLAPPARPAGSPNPA
jgi:putative hydrolase of the HAD superfamily